MIYLLSYQQNINVSQSLESNSFPTYNDKPMRKTTEELHCLLSKLIMTLFVMKPEKSAHLYPLCAGPRLLL